MDDTERAEFALQLEMEADVMSRGDESFRYQYPNTAKLLHQAASRIRADGHRMKAMCKMAVTLNEEIEAAVRRHLEAC